MARMSTRRKMAIATWSTPREGNIYGKLTLDVGEVLDYITWARATSGEKITITHVVGKAMGLALAQAPGLNGRIVLGRFVPFESVDIAFLVVVEGGNELAKVKVSDVDRKSIAVIAAELRAGAERVRAGGDPEFESSKGLMRAGSLAGRARPTSTRATTPSTRNPCNRTRRAPRPARTSRSHNTGSNRSSPAMMSLSSPIGSGRVSRAAKCNGARDGATGSGSNPSA